jgi:hypothetical protein
MSAALELKTRRVFDSKQVRIDDHMIDMMMMMMISSLT